MKKVYYVIHSTGDYEDYNEIIVDACFDLNMAIAQMKTLIEEANKLKTKYDGFQDHVYDCEDDECSICDEYYSLQYDVYEHNGYYLRSIDIRESNEDSFNREALTEYNSLNNKK